MRITCPVCGERSAAEFSFGGDATVEMPALDASTEAWNAAVYDRENPRGPHSELWHHIQGCRAFVRVERDTTTHEILGARLVSPAGDEA